MYVICMLYIYIHILLTDSDSGTSYESYGEEDQDENMYDNVDLPEDVPLPR